MKKQDILAGKMKREKKDVEDGKDTFITPTHAKAGYQKNDRRMPPYQVRTCNLTFTNSPGRQMYVPFHNVV